MKLGIAGSGGIVKEVLLALQEVEEVQVTAIFVRPHSLKKGEALAEQYHIPSIYTDYNEFLQNPDIDFVYIGLINSAHFSYTREALLAGKNVIVEKPFASNLREVKLLAELAQSKKLFLFEAVSLLHMPNYAKLRELLPQLGRITMVQANYSQYSSRYDKYLQKEVLPAFDINLSGGSLYDINIYNLNLIIGLFGAPKSVSYIANIGFNGIDTSGAALLQYDGFPAIATGAKDSDSPSGCTIQGEKGWLRCDGVPGELPSVDLCLRKQEPEHYALNAYSHRLAHEFKDFADIFAAGDFAARDRYLTISLQVAETAEKARLSAGIHFPADTTLDK
ncbi:MAG: Gfo/Idh/MocA family oxidoreductase [Selenomonadaceae bacterium]|nr:Gfo/Idh/MocA family oxidoreductase [Selenomonadaceae bacterium]